MVILSLFIEYKANVEDIKSENVNPAYTNQTSPTCSRKRPQVYM
ncbi:zinc ribbon domain-containing protein [Thalassobacillus sp. C254]